MKNLISSLAILLALFVLLYAEARSAEKESQAEDSYEVVYEQDFDGGDVLEDFQFSDPKAWKTGKTEEGNGFLDLFGSSQYAPPHTSPRNIALLVDKKVKNFVLDLELQQTGKEYGHRDMCVFYNFEDPAHYYYTHIASKTDDRAHNVFIVDGKARTKVSHKTTEGHKWTDGWHHVRIVRNADTGKIAVYVDDMSKPVMEAVDKTLQWGYVGIGSFDDTGRVRHMKLRAPKSEEGDKATKHFEKAAADQ